MSLRRSYTHTHTHTQAESCRNSYYHLSRVATFMVLAPTLELILMFLYNERKKWSAIQSSNVQKFQGFLKGGSYLHVHWYWTDFHVRHWDIRYCANIFFRYFASKQPDFLVIFKVFLSNSSPDFLKVFSLNIGCFFINFQSGSCTRPFSEEMFFFLKYLLNHLTLNYESFEHKKALTQRMNQCCVCT